MASWPIAMLAPKCAPEVPLPISNLRGSWRLSAALTTVSSAPSGGTENGEKLKSCADANLATTHEFVKRLSQEFQQNGPQSSRIHAVLSECG
jgi:hypothetical protein